MDSVIFKKDIAFADDSNNPVFKKNKEYEILNEDKNSFMLVINQTQMSAHRYQRLMKGNCLNINNILLEGDNTYEQYEEID